MSTAVATAHWPGWVKALLIAQFVLTFAVLLPWLLSWTMCAGMAVMQMPGGMPMMPGR
ncbi:MAG: hypothetical protein HY553_03950 [Elusimicrobia bacterium]|nr:hypothetical protein [Elusimicrobiota bacterium]